MDVPKRSTGSMDRNSPVGDYGGVFGSQKGPHRVDAFSPVLKRPCMQLFLSDLGWGKLRPMSHETSSPSLPPFPVPSEYPVIAIVSDTHVGARNSVYAAFIDMIDESKIETIIHTGDVINKPGSLRQWRRFFETTGSAKDTPRRTREPRRTVQGITRGV